MHKYFRQIDGMMTTTRSHSGIATKRGDALVHTHTPSYTNMFVYMYIFQS